MNFAPMNINLFALKINNVDRASNVNLGPTQQTDTFLSTKRNQGVEEVGDLSPIYFPVTNIYDPDGSDGNSIKGSVV